ncbi:hypothetical protein BDP27DRAFT_1318031 [Rhodocollybia butyracea]|uniref:Uncharacterized protein n=1 Tax=Rhodocollybia butyracea TaxID=206335 RepID=A0A9P5Q2R2_9AGAR|nr:hypothetical protein BDP27DRAFT_1318031 [Rhodocollybia butyracea]
MVVSLTVIIAVIVIVGIAVLLVSFLLCSKFKSPKVPLPPVQPLAHHRERSLQTLATEKERERYMYFQVIDRGSLDSSSVSQHQASLSFVSSVHTSRSTSNRGIPYAVQIVLPAPLGSSFIDNSRDSVADAWASQAINNGQPPMQSHSRPRTQSFTKSHSHSRSLSNSSTQGLARPQSLSSTYNKFPASYYPQFEVPVPPPPVPRLPPKYQMNHAPPYPVDYELSDRHPSRNTTLS